MTTRHIPLLWPRFIEKNFPTRTLAFFRDDTLTLEDGRVFHVSDWDTYYSLVFTENLLTFCSKIAQFPYLAELVSLGSVLCHQHGKPIAARLKGARNTTRWLVESSGWDYVTVGPQMLAELRETYQHCDVGTPTTPGALGQALMRKTWKELYANDWKSHRHKVPPAIACEEMAAHRTGARSEVTDQKSMFSTAFELDQKNAYAHAFQKQPTGNCFRILCGAVSGMVTYFVACVVTIVKTLTLGPFPVRDEQGEVSYPRAPGVYSTWLFKEEVEDAESVGCLVKKGKGWGWKQWTEEPGNWVRLMSHLRDSAPSEMVATHIKRAIVAGIGRHGIPAETYQLVPGTHRGPRDVPVSVAGVAYDWWIHAEVDFTPSTLPHWFYYTLMQCRRALYHFSLPFAEQEQFLASNTDAIIVKNTAHVENYVEKLQGIRAATGQWRKTVLYDARMPQKRHLYSKYKTVTPGVPLEMRR